MATAMTEATTDEHQRQLIVDTDVHESPVSLQALEPYLDDKWQEYMKTDSIGKMPPVSSYILLTGHNRHDTRRADGTLGSQYLEQLQWQHLDEYSIDFAILTGLSGYGFAAMPQGDFAAGLATAYNDWLIDTWLGKDQRLRGSITVAPQRPVQAAREIDRVGDHPELVQVVLTIASPEVAWGHEFFDPIWEACERNGLPVAFHVINPAGLLGTIGHVGWPTSFVEARTLYSNLFIHQLVSLVCNGVFEKFPGLRIVMVEGGFAWLPAVMWRLDQSWRSVRLELPWLKRRPSDYIRDHVKLTTQPMEEPDDPKHLLQMIDMMGSESLLMFSTDYPHWDFDSPTRAVPRALPASLRNKIFWENARDFYGLPAA